MQISCISQCLFKIAEPKDPMIFFSQLWKVQKGFFWKAKKAGVKRVVLSSSAYTVGHIIITEHMITMIGLIIEIKILIHT